MAQINKPTVAAGWESISRRPLAMSHTAERATGTLGLFIINKSGGLIYNQDLSPSAPRLTSNDWLRLGSTFHSLHAIAAQVAPIVSGGIEKLETDTLKLQSALRASLHAPLQGAASPHSRLSNALRPA